MYPGDPPRDHDATRPDVNTSGRLAGHRSRSAGQPPTERLGDRGNVGRGSAGSPPRRGRKATVATVRVLRGSGRAASSAGRLARRATTSGGAGSSGLYRLIELHAFNAAGDAALAISLAGTLFFQVPNGKAHGQVALFLAVTMLPFSVMAPLIGPFLDRFRRGRRWAIGTTMATRAFLCWVLAGAVQQDSIWLFPAALGCLVASKAYGVTRASAVPRVLPPEITLVKANSRISLAGVAGAALSAPLAAGSAHFGAQWSLRYAFLVYLGGTILAVLLPARVDSSEGEFDVDDSDLVSGGKSSRRAGIPTSVVTALRCNSGLRVLSGFLTMFMAFLLREHPIKGWEHRPTVLLALVIGAAGFGSTLGTLLGAVLKAVRPHIVVFVTLAADAAAAVYAAFFYGLIAAVVLGLTAGLCQGLGKLSLDAVIQREIAENVRTSVFARSETLLQLSWVIGGFIGVFMPLNARLGLGVIAIILVGWLAAVIVYRPKRSSGRRPPPGRTPRTARVS